MSDVIIAIVPAEGHEGLTAEGPMGERPALLWEGVGIDGRALCPECGSALRWSVAPTAQSDDHYVCGLDWRHDVRSLTVKQWGPKPLVRCDATGRRALVLHAPDGPRLGMVRARAACQGDPTREEVGQFSEQLPVGAMSMDALGIWCFAHLMRVRGIAREVLVLP